MRLIRAHILRSLAGPFGFAWTALTGMLMLNQVSRRFGDLVGKGLSPRVITEVLVLFIPFIVALTLPMAILVAVLYGFSQMASDNEITAMRANGVSVPQMIRPVFLAGMVLSLVNFVFIDQVLPRSNLRLLNLQTDIGQKKPTFSLHERVMNSIPGSLYFLEATTIEPGTGRMREVVIYDMSPPDGRRVIYAESGAMAFERGRKDLNITLYQGHAHEYKTAEPGTVNVTRFRVNSIMVRDIENAFRQNFGSVDRGDREMTTCEMMDHVARSRQTAALAGARRRAMARTDLRVLLHLGVAPDSAAPQPPPLRAHCGAWRKFERWMARRLLPANAAAQGNPPPVVVAAPATDLAAIQARAASAPLVSGLSDVISVREEEAFAIRDVHQYEVEIHKKFTLSLACLNFVLIGIALALRFPRGGVGLVIGASLAVFALFYVTLTAGETLADDGIISAALAMWFPNGIVLGAGLLGLLVVSREFGSTRGGDLADLVDLLAGRFWRRG